MLTKQAKMLNRSQVELVLSHLETKRNPTRNKLIFLLSLHGLRACEIANLEVSSVLNSEWLVGDSIAVLNTASKGKCSGRLVYMSSQLKALLESYLGDKQSKLNGYLIKSERSEKFSANSITVFFKLLYKECNLLGASSHSGRRTFITNCARKIFTAGGSLRDVQVLAGHRSLAMTQRYIEQDVDAQRIVVNLIY